MRQSSLNQPPRAEQGSAPGPGLPVASTGPRAGAPPGAHAPDRADPPAEVQRLPGCMQGNEIGHDGLAPLSDGSGLRLPRLLSWRERAR